MPEILQNNINIISISENGLLMNTNCIRPFYSPNGQYVGFWAQDYNTINDTFLSTYHLYIKDTKTNKVLLVDTGNGYSPLLNDNYSYQAVFSPDSEKILFLTTSTNLISSDTSLYTSPSNNNFRWYIKNLITNEFQRVIEDNYIFGNLYDYQQALWYNNDNVVCVSYSNNLCGVETNLHTEVFLKNINTHILTHISKNVNLSNPNFTSNSYNIAIGNEYISFFNNTLGSCFVKPFTNTFERVQLLPDILNYGIVSSDVLSWNWLGTMFIFRINTGNTITIDTNNAKDDFIYDLENNSIIPINEMSLYGNAESYNSKFSPSGDYVSFLTSSTNIDPQADNGIINLYIKQLSSNIVTKVSKSYNISNNFKLVSDVLGYNWIDNDRLVFTTVDRLENLDNNNEIDWYISNLTKTYMYGVYNVVSAVSVTRLNYIIDDNTQLFNMNNNDPINIRSEMFYPLENKALFSSILSNFDVSFITPYYNKYNIFALTFKNTTIDYPVATQPQHLSILDSVNAIVKNEYSLDVFKLSDYIRRYNSSSSDTFSISVSQNVEHVNSLLYRNINSDIRWMSIKYPNLPINTTNFSVGLGIFQGSSTIIEDIYGVKDGDLTPINPVIGVLSKISVVPQNDVVLMSAGDDQIQICSSIIYLSATIIGNITGHTFLWEQISGSAITLIQNTTTTAYYIVDINPTDKVFRFWVDKGKYNEQYQDITVYSTPTSFLNTQLTNSIQEGEVIDDNLKVRGYGHIDNTFNPNIPFSGVGSFNVNPSIEWTLPNIYYIPSNTYYDYYKSIFYSTYLEIHDGNNWIKQNEALYNESRIQINIQKGTLMRFASTYQRLGQINKEVYYTLPEKISSSMLGYNVISKIENSINSNTTLINTIYNITLYNFDDTISNYNNNSIAGNAIINTTVYEIDMLMFNDTITNINNSISSGFTLTIFGGDTIGG